MSFTSHQLHWNGATGSHSNSSPEYTAVYRLFSDDPDDQSQTAIAYVLANIAALGDSYAYANDANASALLDRIDANRELGTNNVWIATLHYAVPSGDDGTEEGGTDSDGNPTNDPLEFRDEVSIDSVQYTVPMLKAEYLSGFGGMVGPKWPPGKIGPVVNSCLMPFDPPPEADDSRQVVTIKRNRLAFDADEHAFENVVNNQNIGFVYRGVTKVFMKYTAKIRRVGCAMRRVNNIDFLEVSITIDHKRDGWRFEFLDQGMYANQCQNQPNGRGGEIGPGDILEGTPPVRALADPDEQPITQPVLLDGHGQPLDVCNNAAPCYIKYRYHEERDYKALAIFQDPDFFTMQIFGGP